MDNATVIVTHEWTGEPHASASIKKINGVEAARNLIAFGEKPNNPSTAATISYDADGYIQLTPVGSNIPYAAFVRNDSVALLPDTDTLTGKTFTVTFEAKSSNATGEALLYLGANQNTYYEVEGEMGGEFSTFSLTREWPENGSWRPHFSFRNDEIGVTYTLRHVKFELGDVVRPYFDGNSGHYATRPARVYDGNQWATYNPVAYIDK